MKKQISDYLHLYLGCDLYYPETKEIRVGMDWTHLLDMWSEVKRGREYKPSYKLMLRPLSDMNEEDFYSFFKAETERDILIKATLNRFWCAGYYDKEEYNERIAEELPVDGESLIYDLEEADHTNVFSTTKQGDIAHGCSDELRYFIDVETLSAWLNHLRKRAIDTDGLIKAGLAIDKTKIPASHE